ncbi:hypothetical protein AAW51_2342 [Caldimonas brevitalea]|uniref:Radical SAM core domain-containing protein n=1 Tax=Caldimonas brevitalea TaxID=413882 RepID=A0A0G3BM14_9BURK|nr:hypothetical protein AAW51_2342 [Caldimonas brevitalea]
MVTAENVHRIIAKELNRPQVNRVLHAHPSPLQWNKEEIDFSQHCKDRLDLNKQTNRSIGLYVGIPFCIPTDPPHCGFCLFPTESYRGKDSMETYLNYLEKEAEMYRAFNPDVNISSLYVGGGTPNLMREDQYARLMAIVNKTFGGLRSDIEISLEGIPQLYKEERIREIKEAGFNRVSMGVQQINDDLIHYSGRNQTRRQIFDAIEYFNKYDLAFNVDLIFGWPEQTVERMVTDLQDLVNTGIRHITHYELNIGGISDFAMMQRDKLPPKEVVHEMYRVGREFLLSQGFQQRTIYDWERPEIQKNGSNNVRAHEYQFEDNLRKVFEVQDGEILSRHEMLGLGYAGISFANGYPEPGKSWTTANSRALKDYYDKLDRDLIPVAGYYFRSDADVKLSFLFQSLQEMKINTATYKAIFGSDVREELAEVWSTLTDKGWIQTVGDEILVNTEFHLYIPIIQTVLASSRTAEIVQEHRNRHKSSTSGSPSGRPVINIAAA